MISEEQEIVSSPSPAIYIVSGGTGASGEQVVHTLLAQFPENRLPVITVSNVRQTEQIDLILEKAKAGGGIVIHTLVEAGLRQWLNERARDQQVAEIDLMGPLFDWIGQTTGQAPLGQPGLYRKLHKDYFERVAAIEYTMAHDDGRNPEGWKLAEIVLTGPSRVGKTPLSLYLSVLGWKVANVPIVPGVPPAPELFHLDPTRVIGLKIEPGQLLQYRQQRQMRLGAPGPSLYMDPQAIYEEVQAVQRIFRMGKFRVVDVTDKPIESSADEIIRLISRQGKGKANLT